MSSSEGAVRVIEHCRRNALARRSLPETRRAIDNVLDEVVAALAASEDRLGGR